VFQWDLKLWAYRGYNPRLRRFPVSADQVKFNGTGYSVCTSRGGKVARFKLMCPSDLTFRVVGHLDEMDLSAPPVVLTRAEVRVILGYLEESSDVSHSAKLSDISKADLRRKLVNLLLE